MTNKDNKSGMFNQFNLAIAEKMQKVKKLFSGFSSFMEKNSETHSSADEMERIIAKMAIIGLMDSIKTYADAIKQTVSTSTNETASTDKNYVLPIYMNAMLNALAITEKLLAKEEARSMLKNTEKRGSSAPQKSESDADEVEEEEELDSLIYSSDPVDPDDGIVDDEGKDGDEDNNDEVVVDKDAFDFFTEKLGKTK